MHGGIVNEHVVSRRECHIAPDRDACVANIEKEPEGERIRMELEDFLRRNKIVSIMMDTPEHMVSIDIVKLPPRIKPILRLWGSVFIKDEPEPDVKVEQRSSRLFIGEME
jgi:hypothetical protein